MIRRTSAAGQPPPAGNERRAGLEDASGGLSYFEQTGINGAASTDDDTRRGLRCERRGR